MRRLERQDAALAALAAVFAMTGTFAFSNPARADSPGTVAILEGNAYAQRGEIYYTHPVPGQEVRVNQFGQYRDAKPDAPAFVKWDQNTRRHLHPNDSIEEGDIIQTMGDGWTRLLLKDDSLVDIAPASMVQLQKFQGEGKDRRVVFKMLYGKVRGIVVQPTGGPDHYELITPNSLMGVKGTEFLIDVYPDTEHRTQTQIVCLHGQVSVDVNKFNTKGLVYTQPTVLIPGSIFATSGVNGLGMTTTLKPVSQDKLRSLVAELSPLVNTRATIVGAVPPPSRLPGTGIALEFVAQREARRIQAHDPHMNTFDLDHPPAERMIASASGNFEIPHDFADDSAGFGRVRDIRNFTGVPKVQFLPATTSHVNINIIGIR